MSKASKDALDQLHGALARSLADKIASGEATASDLNVARQFLKDNGIDAIPAKGTPLGDLAVHLPFLSTGDIAEEDATLQ